MLQEYATYYIYNTQNVYLLTVPVNSRLLVVTFWGVNIYTRAFNCVGVQRA